MTEHLIAKQKGLSLAYADNRDREKIHVVIIKISKPLPNRTAHLRFWSTVIILQANKARSKSHIEE